MSRTLESKKIVVKQAGEIAMNAVSAVAAEYTGLTVAEMTELRRSARAARVHIMVLKNTLAKRAFKDTSFECMNGDMVGPLLLAFSNDEPGSAARVIRDFSMDHEKLVVKIIALDGRLFAESDLTKLADMPSLDMARSMLLQLLKQPLEKFVRTLCEPQAKLTRLISAYTESKR